MKWRGFERLIVALVLPVLGTAGCRSPYMERNAALNRRNYSAVYSESMRDIKALGRFDVDGDVSHRSVRGGFFSSDKEFFDIEIMAGNLLPQAYLDLARVALAGARFYEAIRHAQHSMEAAERTLSEDHLLFQRMRNIRDANLMLYKAYLAMGDVEQAAISFRYHLIMSELIDSMAGKELQAQLACIRMTSMRLRSEHATKRHWSNMGQILNAIAAVAQASAAADASKRGDHRAAARYRAASIAHLMAISVIQEYKDLLELNLKADVAQLMAQAGAAGVRMKSPPSREDILNAKRASALYRQLRVRRPLDPADRLDLSELDDLFTAAVKEGLLVRQGGFAVVPVSNVARAIAAAGQLDRVPLTLPPIDPDREDEWLDSQLTPALYRLAGISLSAAEMTLLRELAEKREDVKIDPSTESGQQMIAALRKLEQRMQAYVEWRDEGGGGES